MNAAQILRLETIRARNAQLEDLLYFHLRAERMPVPLTGYGFLPSRKWAFDFAWTDLKIAVEIEGGTKDVRCGACHGHRCIKCRWTGRIRGRHTSAAGYENDCEKYNHAQALGWRVFRFTADMVKSGRAIQFLKEILARGEPQ